MDMNSTQNSENSDRDLWSLKSIERISVVLGLLFFVVALYLKPTLPVLLGVGSGVLVGWLNFRLLGRFVSKLVAKSHLGQSKSGLALVLKMVFLIVVVAILILVIKVNPLGFILGFSANILAILIEALRVMF
jgi:hypothetical protein